MVAAACGLHMVALVGSDGIWGGVRHAMPVMVAAAIVAGAVLACAWRHRSPALLAGVALQYVAAAAMTLRDPRLCDSHHELDGGRGQAYRQSGNEGLALAPLSPALPPLPQRNSPRPHP